MKSSSERFKTAFSFCKEANFKGALVEYEAILSGYPKTKLHFAQDDFIRTHLNIVNVNIHLIRTKFYNREENFFPHDMSDDLKELITEKTRDGFYLDRAVDDIHHHISRIKYLCTKTHEGIVIDQNSYQEAKHILENLDEILSSPPADAKDQQTLLSGEESDQTDDMT